MKKNIMTAAAVLALLGTQTAFAAETTDISLFDDRILVDGKKIIEQETDKVYLNYKTETHSDVPEELADLQNRVVTITDAGTYVFSGAATDVQIAVEAEDTLAANNRVTREEWVQMLYNYLGDEYEGAVPDFRDIEKVTAENTFAWAVNERIISGRQETIRPQDYVTKA